MKPNIIEIRKDTPPKEVIVISPDGKLFWYNREVETDDDFRSAMLDLAEALKPKHDRLRQLEQIVFWLRENRPEVWEDIKKWNEL